MLPADFQVEITVEDQERIARQMEQMGEALAIAADSMRALEDVFKSIFDEFERSMYVFARIMAERVSELASVLKNDEFQKFLMENEQCE